MLSCLFFSGAKENAKEKSSGEPRRKRQRKICQQCERKRGVIEKALKEALFEGVIFGGAYLRREICVSKSIGLTL